MAPRQLKTTTALANILIPSIARTECALFVRVCDRRDGAGKAREEAWCLTSDLATCDPLSGRKEKEELGVIN